LKQHKPWFVEECLGFFLHQRQHAKIQHLQDQNQSNIHNLIGVRHEASRHFMNKKMKYLKAKIDDLELTVG